MPPGRELPPRHRECSEPRPKSHLRPYAWPPHLHMTQNSVKTDPKQVIPQLTHCRAHEAWPAHESPPRHRRCNESRPKRHFQALFTAPTSRMTRKIREGQTPSKHCARPAYTARRARVR